MVHFQITLRRNAEGIGHPVKEGKHRCDVNRLSDLRLTPAVVAQRLNVRRGGAIRRLRHLGDIFEQNAVCIVEPRLCKIAGGQRLDCFLFSSLNPQEVSMRVQSIGAAIEPGNPAGNRFFRPPREVPFREVHRVAEADDFAQKVRAMAKALEDPRHLLATGMRTPFVIYRRHVAGSVSILNQVDLCRGIRHNRLMAKA